MKKLISLITLFKFVNLTQNIIPLTLQQFENNYGIMIGIGNSNDSLQKLQLDMSISYLLLSTKNFKNEDVIKSESHSLITIADKEIKVEQFLANISLNENNTVLNMFPFYFTDTKLTGTYDSFPLGYEIKDEQYSVIHYLHNEKLIDNKKFAFSFDLENKKGTLYLGGIPDLVLKDYLYDGQCKVIDGVSSWNCELNKIIIEDKTYSNGFSSKFQSNQKYILAPTKFIEHLETGVFKSYLENNTCVKEIVNDVTKFLCKCKEVEYFPSLLFLLGDVVLPFNNTMLFDKKKDLCHFIIESNNLNSNEWILGVHFIGQFKTMFDYREKKVKFYSNVPFEIVKPTKKNKVILVLGLIGMSIGMTVMIVIFAYLMAKGLKHSDFTLMPSE